VRGEIRRFGNLGGGERGSTGVYRDNVRLPNDRFSILEILPMILSRNREPVLKVWLVG
jgi:hypothetical protein